MRQIKFRGKRKDNGEWVEGNCIDKIWRGKAASYIHVMLPPSGGADIEVDPATVGQFTGLKDKNGKEIYEGDIIIIPAHYIGDYEKKKTRKTVEWDGTDNPEGPGFWLSVAGVQWKDTEVIGNVHDNPELLEKAK